MIVRLNWTNHVICTTLLFSVLADPVYGLLASWLGPRAALVRDAIFIEGGVLQTGNFEDSSWTNTSIMSSHGGGVLASLDLTVPFTASNYTNALTFLRETQDANAPGYVYGGLFATSDGFVTFGGVPNSVRPSTLPNSMQSFRYNDSRTAVISTIPIYKDGMAGVYQNVSAGSSVSIPSEHLGFYFGGMTLSNNNSWRYPLPNATGLDSSSSFYKWDVSDLSNPRGAALESLIDIETRAEAEIIWIPFGKKGALVLIGGVQYPADLYASTRSPVQATNNTFMADLHIYDIANDKWSLHTAGQNDILPPQTASFCAVGAVARDRTSYNIYIYGGYDGKGAMGTQVFDSVWILSLPAFRYIRVPGSTTSHGRKSHRCLTPYPNQMMTVGGTALSGGALASDAMFDVFDMNTLNWTGHYDPLKWSDYQVPKLVSNVIGGGEDGGAHFDAHVAALPADLAALFKTPYQGNIPKYYPYARKTIKYFVRKVPNWLRWVIGMLAYLLVLSTAFTALMFLRQRKFLKTAGLEGKDLGPGHSAISYMGKRFNQKSKTPIQGTTIDGALKPLSLLHIEQNKQKLEPYTDNESEIQSVRTRMSTRSDERLLSEEFEMDMMQTLHRSRI